MPSKSSVDDVASKSSTALGHAITIGAVASRLPQIVKILRLKSVEGLSPSLFVVDAICNAVTALYHAAHQVRLILMG